MIPKNRVTTHPGTILLKEFLEPMELSQKKLADHLRVRYTTKLTILLKMEAVMKLKSLLLVLITFVLSSCSAIDSDLSKTVIVGEWDWIESTHGWSGERVLPSSVGYSQHLIYRSDNTFLHFRNDTLFSSGKYSVEISENKTILKYEIANNNYHPKQQLEYLKNDVIKLIDLCMDCGTSTYKLKR